MPCRTSLQKLHQSLWLRTICLHNLKTVYFSFFKYTNITWSVGCKKCTNLSSWINNNFKKLKSRIFYFLWRLHVYINRNAFQCFRKKEEQNAREKQLGRLCVKPYPIDYSAIKRLKRVRETFVLGRGMTSERDKELNLINV